MSVLSTPTRFQDTAIALRQNGYIPIPIKPCSKQPARSWKHAYETPPSLATLSRDITHFGPFGTAIICGPVVGIDVDFIDDALAAEAKRVISEIVQGVPLERVGQAPKRLFMFRTDKPVRTVHRRQFDVLGRGSYFLAYGVHPVTRRPFEWIGPSPLEVPLASLPPINTEQIDRITLALEELLDRVARPIAPQFDDRSGLILDGRDVELRRIVYDVWNSGIDDHDELVAKSWLLFQQRVDLRRPKRDGSEQWSQADVVAKAASLLRRAAEGKVYRSASGADMRYDVVFEPFMQAIYAMTARRRLPNAAADLSFVMLCLCRNGGGCFASVNSLARQIKRSPVYVKKVRAQLQREGFWVRRLRGSGRGNASEYYPCIDVAIAEAKKVCFQGPYITSVRGTLEVGESSKNQKNNNTEENSISLSTRPEGGVA